MAANIWEENVFSVREPMWHGLGHVLSDAPTWDEIPMIINSNWKADKLNAYSRLPIGVTSNLQVVDTETGEIRGYVMELTDDFEIVRHTDGNHFGFVGKPYTICQNDEVIELFKAIAGLGAKPETGGFLDGGKTIFLTCKANTSVFAEEAIDEYLVITNTHGGGGAIKVMFTNIRVVCQNTLSAVLHGAKRSYSFKHTTNLNSRIDEAVETLRRGENYSSVLGAEIEAMKMAKITPERAKEMLDEVVIKETASKLAKLEQLKKATPFNPADRIKNAEKIAKLQGDIDLVRSDLYNRYFNAPDLAHMGDNQFRLWNAISDYATHTSLHKRTADYSSNMFKSFINESKTGKIHLIDFGYNLAKAA